MTGSTYHVGTKTHVVPFGAFYTNPGEHVYAVMAMPNRINILVRETIGNIYNNNGVITKEERQTLPNGYVKVTFTYEIQ